MNVNNPLIVQSDKSILLEVDHALHAEARDALAQFAELEKSPEHIHTYRLSPLSLWNAAAGGMNAEMVLELLTLYSKYAIPSNIIVDIREYMGRYGRIKLIREGDALLLTSNDAALIADIQRATLILSPNTIAVRQWIQEILDKTDLPPEMVGEYTGERKDICPITVSTYQILTYRRTDTEDFPHFSLFTSFDWGLIIYDEVHLLPAPVFRITAEIQARRRLGLTATLVREDGREADVFSLIGPKKYDVPWRELERQGWIATAECHEIRVSMNEDEQLNYAVAEEREKYRLAAENPAKLPIIRYLAERHLDDQVLIIGQYIDQLKLLATELDAPLLTGRTSNLQREKLYDQFRRGEIKRMVVSKVANFAIDLPDANVAIQVSGTFGSRQEEAQRLGRILRPKPDGGLAYFYSIVTRDTPDQEFSANRQLFLTEQGYRYVIEDAEELLASEYS